MLLETSANEIRLEPGDPYDGSGPPDPVADAIKKNRDNYDKVLWLFGDSILRGFALGRFPDAFSRNEIASEPFWNFRSPAATINMLLKSAGLLREDHFGVVSDARYVACYGGLVGQPDLIPPASKYIAHLVKAGLLRSPDTLVYLDAGHHTGDPDRYESQWATMRKAAVERLNATLLMCSSFDDLTHGGKLHIGNVPREMLMYDVPFPSATGARTHNDAIRAAATEPRDFVGRTVFIDMSEIIRRRHCVLRECFGLSAYRHDRIHLNVFGQTYMALELASTAWPELSIQKMLSPLGLP